MKKTVVIIAGLSIALHDRVRKESANRFAPDGHLAVKPVHWEGYPTDQAAAYTREIADAISKWPEETQIAILLAYVDYQDESTRNFINGFFPFALTKPVAPINSMPNARARDYVEKLGKEVDLLRDRSAMVCEHTNVHNLTPLLLPVRNFRSNDFNDILRKLYNDLGTALDPRQLLKQELDRFIKSHPRAFPGTDNRSCLSDHTLFFKSPGKHRHGFYRHSSKNGHRANCLLNARCRLGGTYDYKFHYDCEPAIKGSLATEFPNCHDASVKLQKVTHVNISPNDYIS